MIVMIMTMTMIVAARVYTLADLAGIAGSGISVVGGEYVLQPDNTLESEQLLDAGGLSVSATELTVNAGNTLNLLDGDVLRFGPGVRLSVDGNIDAVVETGALLGVTADATASALGLRVIADDAQCHFKNVTFEYVGITYGSAEGSLLLEDCTFKAHNGKLSNNAVNFVVTGKGNEVRDCVFEDCYGGCIATGAVNPVGINIVGCRFLRNGTSGRLLPAINICCGGENDIIIDDNEVVGIGNVTRTGGIALSNLMGIGVNNTCYVRRNEVRDNSYGITMTGGGAVYIEDNHIVRNNMIANAMSGGSGINITNNAGTSRAYIRGNHIEENFWGITVIGANDVNCGKLVSPEDVDYNPGENVFLNNGNGDGIYAKCDFANNGSATVYAQGNTWSVGSTDLEALEDCIYHKADNASLGEVIYLPTADSSGIDVVEVDSLDEPTRYYDLQGRCVPMPQSGNLYIRAGKLIRY